MSDPTAAPTTEQTVTITRVFDAPRQLVFEAWTNPDHLSAWFGPAGFDTPRETVEIDARVGGRLNLRMVKRGAPVEYSLSYEIVELIEPELLVLRSEPMPEMGVHHHTITRIELHEDGGKTRMTVTDGPFSEPGARGASAGWETACDRLEEVLAGSS
jgi:uncharacterized protein YndB with AHSA1/START domain